ncbi:MAG: hypothetical protein JTT11_05325 [Candidatus Brockarchaeota archaeon]|nr:hypothetical protein [Candidatus Brockarchaeota archaeon]
MQALQTFWWFRFEIEILAEIQKRTRRMRKESVAPLLAIESIPKKVRHAPRTKKKFEIDRKQPLKSLRIAEPRSPKPTPETPRKTRWRPYLPTWMMSRAYALVAKMAAKAPRHNPAQPEQSFLLPIFRT